MPLSAVLDGLRHLAKLTQLKELWLYGLDDDAAQWLGQMKSLTRLSISEHHFRDESFRHLERLPHLEYLDARTLRMTRAQLQELDRRLPDTYVRTDGGGLLDKSPPADSGHSE